MQAPERAPPRSAPHVTPHEDGLPWVRFITGLAALAMLAIPVGRHVADDDTRPIATRVVTAQALPAGEPLPKPVLRSRETEDASLASAEEVAREGPSTRAASPVAAALSSQRRDVRTTAAAHHLQRVATERWRPHTYKSFARTKHVLTRAQVEREYLASREQVAALTREDSGSAWLMRVGAQQRTPRRHALATKGRHGAADRMSTRV